MTLDPQTPMSPSEMPQQTRVKHTLVSLTVIIYILKIFKKKIYYKLVITYCLVLSNV